MLQMLGYKARTGADRRQLEKAPQPETVFNSDHRLSADSRPANMSRPMKNPETRFHRASSFPNDMGLLLGQARFILASSRATVV